MAATLVKVARLYGGRGAVGVVILPEPTDLKVVIGAWSYAIRYSAKGLDVPDYGEAVKLLQQRHPAWLIEYGEVYEIAYDVHLAENDTPE